MITETTFAKEETVEMHDESIEERYGMPDVIIDATFVEAVEAGIITAADDGFTIRMPLTITETDVFIADINNRFDSQLNRKPRFYKTRLLSFCNHG